MSIARVTIALCAALTLGACAPDAPLTAEPSALETLELLALSDRISAALDERDALAAARDARATTLPGPLTLASAISLQP